MPNEKQQKLAEFVEWAAEHITGDEKGEAQVFLDRLFQAFGHGGVKEAGATLEYRVKKKRAIGGTTFADLVFKPYVLIEMKKRGEKLDRHYNQAFDYWARLTNGRPRYVILCNFDEFWVYDFDSQLEFPVDKVNLDELPDRHGPLAFLFAKPESPVFGNDHEAVTREAADLLARCFNSLVEREVERTTAQRFVLQMLVALFSEDIGLLEQYLVTRILAECETPQDSYDLLGGMFNAMNSKVPASGGRYKGINYFNGGLFADPVHLELQPGEVHLLREAAKADWSKVRPEIFGTLFEHSLDKDERHAFGAHFTSPVDIMKVVQPTIIGPWSEAIEGARTQAQLNKLLTRMQSYRVLDPACGSGNFLYVAYRALKRLEARIFERLTELTESKKTKAQTQIGFVTAQNFFGVDINPFAVEIAKVTMMIARKLAIDELNIQEKALPLDNLDGNFVSGDALVQADGFVRQWPQTDVIIGNPPFMGAKRLKPERGADYVNTIRALYPEVPGMADYCVYWFRKANDHLKDCAKQDQFAGRAGLVGTQNIRNNKSRVGGLDYIAETGTIIEAVDNQPWSGEANVHVSIANWVRTKDKSLLPKERKLWYKLEPSKQLRKIRKRGDGPAHKEYDLGQRVVAHINSALSDKADVSGARVLSVNLEDCLVCQGVTPGHSAFVLTSSQANSLTRKDESSASVVFPYLIGRDLLTGDGTPTRYIIDLGDRDMIEARRFSAVFTYLTTDLLPDLEKKAELADAADSSRSGHLGRWWRHWRPRTELIETVGKLKRYIVCSRVTKRPVFVFVDCRIRPGDALQAFAFEDDYSFGILQSNVHWEWFVEKCSKLKSDFRYTPESVFGTFPWPQDPKNKDVDVVAAAARQIREIRADALTKVEGGLRALYRMLELPGDNPLRDAHQQLDAAVLKAYGFSPKKDLLSQTLELNQTVAKALARGKAATGPGIPASYPKPKNLISDDCIQAEPLG